MSEQLGGDCELGSVPAKVARIESRGTHLMKSGPLRAACCYQDACRPSLPTIHSRSSSLPQITFNCYLQLQLEASDSGGRHKSIHLPHVAQGALGFRICLQLRQAEHQGSEAVGRHGDAQGAGQSRENAIPFVQNANTIAGRFPLPPTPSQPANRSLLTTTPLACAVKPSHRSATVIQSSTRASTGEGPVGCRSEIGPNPGGYSRRMMACRGSSTAGQR